MCEIKNKIIKGKLHTKTLEKMKRKMILVAAIFLLFLNGFCFMLPSCHHTATMYRDRLKE